jgi:hypothetical protein
VQQAVIGAGRAGIDIAFFNQYALHSPQRQISGNACSGRPTADNEYLRIQF